MPAGPYLAGALFAAVLVWPAGAQEQAKDIPDFSGVWGRNTIHYSPL